MNTKARAAGLRSNRKRPDEFDWLKLYIYIHAAYIYIGIDNGLCCGVLCCCGVGCAEYSTLWANMVVCTCSLLYISAVVLCD